MSDKPNGYFAGFLAVLALLTGCTYGYVDTATYGPEQEWSQQRPSSPPVSRYPIPSSDPKGAAYVLSMGAERLPGRAGEVESFLHLRVAVENTADAVAWILYPGEMKVMFDGSSPVSSTYARSTPTGSPLSVAKGMRGELDLYFPVAMAGRALHADFLWPIHRGSETVTTRTVLDMLDGPAGGDVYYAPAYQTGVDFAYGPGWWWGPEWYWGVGWWGAPWWWGWGGLGWRGGPRFGGYHGGGYHGGHH
jgi:hypothetical protein